MKILLTGATGYVGGRLLKKLELQGYRVRCLARRPEYLKEKIGPATELVEGDLLNEGSLVKAMAGIEIAYYLVHSMGMYRDFKRTFLPTPPGASSPPRQALFSPRHREPARRRARHFSLHATGSQLAAAPAPAAGGSGGLIQTR